MSWETRTTRRISLNGRVFRPRPLGPRSIPARVKVLYKRIKRWKVILMKSTATMILNLVVVTMILDARRIASTNVPEQRPLRAEERNDIYRRVPSRRMATFFKMKMPVHLKLEALSYYSQKEANHHGTRASTPSVVILTGSIRPSSVKYILSMHVARWSLSLSSGNRR